MNIPMVDLKAIYAELQTEIDAAVLGVLGSGSYILGPQVKALEQEIAAYLGVSHAIACASGTDALHLALRAAGLGPQTEVITTPFSFIATAEAIAYTGAKPVFVDIDPQTYNIDPQQVIAAITPRTRAIVPVHLYGQPAEMAVLREIATQHNLILIEDCAQAFGASYQGKKVGSLGDMGCFSFYPSKNLGAFGDGGIVVTSDPEKARLVRLYREHGHIGNYQHAVIGYNSRLDEIQAAILRIRLKHLDRHNALRRQHAAAYGQHLQKMGLQAPIEAPDRLHVYHQYTFRSIHRDRIRQALNSAGIAAAIYYPIPIHRQASFAALTTEQPCTQADQAAQTVLSLPMHPHLQPAHIDQIAAIIQQVLESV